MQEDFHSFAYSAIHLACRGDGQIDRAEIRAVLTSLANMGDVWELRPTKAMKGATQVYEEYAAERAAVGQAELDAKLMQRLTQLKADTPPETLRRLYKELKIIAAADGDIAQGEKQLLHRIRDAWALPADAV